MVRRALGQGQAEIAKAQATRLGVEQRHAEQQEGGGGGGEHHVLDAGLQRMALAIGIAHQPEHRQGQHLDPDEERCQMAGAGQHQATGGGDEQQQEELLPVVRIGFQPGLAESAGGQGADQHQPHVEDGVAVYLQQRGDSLIALRHHDG